MARSRARFDALVKRAGVNPCVDLPAAVSREFAGRAGRRVLIRVHPRPGGQGRAGTKTARDKQQLIRIGRLTSDGWFRTTIIKVTGQPDRIFLDTWMRDSAGVHVGDTVTLALQPDLQSRTLSMPAALRAALSKDPQAKKAWDALAHSRKRERLTYLNFLKSSEAMDRAVQKVLAELRR